jgi:hypothetical protein
MRCTRIPQRGHGAPQNRQRARTGSGAALLPDGPSTSCARPPRTSRGTRNLGAVASPRRSPPPPLEGNEQLITTVITAGWAIALIVVLIFRSSIPAAERWWIWTCAAGVAMGIFGLWYVPRLKRSRARAAARRAARFASRAGQESAVRPDGAAVQEGTGPQEGATPQEATGPQEDAEGSVPMDDGTPPAAGSLRDVSPPGVRTKNYRPVYRTAPQQADGRFRGSSPGPAQRQDPPGKDSKTVSSSETPGRSTRS